MTKRVEQFTLNVFDGRLGDETTWNIPLTTPSHHWAVPLAILEGEEARRVGTAFHFSRLGHLFSARHCVDEALRASDRGVGLAERGEEVRMENQLLVIRAEDEKRNRVTGFSVQTVTGPEPTDLVCLSPMSQERMPQLTLPLSFALPNAGSTVRCFGFPSSLRGKLFPDFLHAVEGVVKAYFPPGFTRGFMKGPCFLVGASLPHGMSGGPVVNEEGAVCGIASAGAELFVNEPACLVTPLYPALLIDVALHAEPAPNFRINATRRFLDLCAEGYVKTDGTEDRVHFAECDQGVEIGPIVSKPNGAYVYNSFEDYLEGRRSTPLTGPRMHIVKHRDSDPVDER